MNLLCNWNVLFFVLLFTAASEQSSEYTDQISAIEVSAHQITILTTKVGPLETLHIQIDIVDLHNNQNVTVYNLPGTLLQLARGRYSLIVAPDRWYGIAFKSENVFNENRYKHSEGRLVRTPPEDQAQARIGVKVTFHSDYEHIENIILQAKWVDKETRNALTMIGVTTELQCNKTTLTQTFYLQEWQLFVNQSFEARSIEEFRLITSPSATIAKVSAKSCESICWEQTLVANRFGQQFISYHENRACQNILPVNASAPIRTYQDYNITDGLLSIYTKFKDPKNSKAIDQAIVKINASVIGEHNDESSTTEELYAAYNTNEHPSNKYSLDYFVPGKWYAVIYEYTLFSPFRFHEQKRFIVQSESVAEQNSSDDNIPIRFHFLPDQLNNNEEKDDEKRLPSVSLERNVNYNGYNILAIIPAPCEDMENDTEVWLDDSNPSVNLNIDLVNMLCSNLGHYKFCQEEIIKNTVMHCEKQICFDAYVVIDGEKYEMKEHCENIFQHYSETPTIIRSSSIFNTYASFSFFISYLFFSQGVLNFFH